jgi:hypothetical protein
MEVTLEQIHLVSHVAICHLQSETVNVHRPLKIHLKNRVMNTTGGSHSCVNVELVSRVVKCLCVCVCVHHQPLIRAPFDMADCLRRLHCTGIKYHIHRLQKNKINIIQHAILAVQIR